MVMGEPPALGPQSVTNAYLLGDPQMPPPKSVKRNVCETTHRRSSRSARSWLVRVRRSGWLLRHRFEKSDHPFEIVDARGREQVVDVRQYGLNAPRGRFVAGPGREWVHPDDAVH